MVKMDFQIKRNFTSSFILLVILFFGLAVFAVDPNANGSWSELIDQRDSNTRVWEVTKNGKASFVHEVGGGICYKDDFLEWQVSDTSWASTVDGFVMDKAGYKLEIGNTAGSLMTYHIDGRQLMVKPCKLTAINSGQAVDIAQLDANAVGQIDAANPTKLIFVDAFGTGIDLEIEANPGGYHQNVIFRQKPTLPDGMDAALTKLQLFTEMDLDSFESSKAGSVGLVFDTTDIASQIVNDPNGLLLPMGVDGTSVSLLSTTDRSKDNIYFMSQDIDGKDRVSHFLGKSDIFAVDGTQSQCIGTAEKEFIRDGATNKTYLVETLDASVITQSTNTVVWDYSSVSGTLTANTIWECGETYYVSSSITLGSGIELTIEPGAFVKFGSGTSLLATDGFLIAKGKGFNPVIFTSMNDDTVGVEIPNSTSTPAAGDYGNIYIGSGSKFEFCKVYYSTMGLVVSASPAEYIKNNEFRYCDINCIYADLPNGATIDIFNNLFVSSNYYGIGVAYNSGTFTANIKNNTFDSFDATGQEAVSIWGTYDGSINAKDNLFTNCNSCIYNHSTGTLTSSVTHNSYYWCTSPYSNSISPSPSWVTLSASPYYQQTYYLAQNGNAIGAGSHSNGMAGFTTDAVDNTEDLNAIDIGYHHSCLNPYTDAMTWYVSTTGDDGDDGSEANPFATIQYAIDIASYRDKGDTVIVGSGTYNEDIEFKNKDITVKSSHPDSAETTVNGYGVSATVRFGGDERDDCVLSGFTITSSSDTGIEAHWKLDDGTGTSVSDSAGSNTGTLHNMESADWVSGRTGETGDFALDFDGIDEYVNASNVLNPSAGGFSACAWVKDVSDGLVIISQAGGRNWLMLSSTGCLKTKLRESGGGGLDSTSLLETGWNHVAVVWDGKRRYIYLNGENVVSDHNDIGSMETCSGVMYIGANMDGDASCDGLVDDVRVYDRGLSSNEILQVYEGDFGGGIFGNGTEATISGCVVTGNTARYGGGIALCDGVIESCLIVENEAVDGGGLFNTGTNTTVTNCVFEDNSSTGGGGGIYLKTGSTSPDIINCVFVDNYAGNNAGGLYVGTSSTPDVINCTFYRNTTSTYGGAVKIANNLSGYATTFANCIFWGNDASGTANGEEIYFHSNSTAEFYNCDIQDGLTGARVVTYGNGIYNGGGNINSNPTFVSTTDLDGTDGKWMTSDDGLMLLSASQCKGAGNDDYVDGTYHTVDYDIVGNDRQNSTVDIGAYEYYLPN